MHDLAMSLAIDARQLSKNFGRQTAVADLTLQVQRGEVFAFLGPNGAGKTTAIKMLLGLVRPSSGQAAVLGRPLGDRAARRHIGFLPEHFRFHDWLQADEFLHLHGRLFGLSRAERAAVIPDLLELVGLTAQAGLRLRAFSKGMQQRLGLAQALLNDPQLVFLDEPTSGLDPLGRRLVRHIINDLRASGTAVFLNSHLLSEVELTCDRAAFIKEGRVLQVLSMADLAQGQIQVRLRVGRPDAALLAGLAQFGGAPALDPATGRITLTVADESRLPALAAWLQAEGQALYELSPRPLTLEEQFVAIMGPEAGPG